ncbi:MAG: DEAD/DEAH box helicase family protein, partial [Acidimicrobiales bacterium]
MNSFVVESPFSPSGDQPQAIATLAQGVQDGLRFQTLEGITGSGKTATIAWLVERVQRPTLILEPNKSLAAQLASELKEMLPNNRVEFFVSYYDYYQPEAYIPRTDTFIEKDSSVNEEIDRLRHAATSSLLTHRDTIVVASVSCIYGLGSPIEYRERMLRIEVGTSFDQRMLLRRLIEMQYNRNDLVLERGVFRMKGDTLEIQPAYSSEAVRVSFFGDEVEEISFFNPVTQESRGRVDEFTLFAASHYATSNETLHRACGTIEEELQVQLSKFQSEGKLLEAQRLRSRTEHDLEMLEQTGICAGIENYSAHLDGRKPGERPYTLLDYFPEDFLVVIDESHVAVPQVRGQYAGDRSRKLTLVEHGFRLPSALDNRPLNFDEFMELVPQMVFVSATPGPYELEHSDQIAEQVIRPTGLIDPVVSVVPT